MSGQEQEKFTHREQSEWGSRPTTLECSSAPEPRAETPRWPWMCLAAILGIALLLQILHLSFFNGLNPDDGIFIQYAFNVAQGQLGMGAYGSLLGLGKFHVGDPFGYPLVMAAVFRLFGAGPVTAKLLPLVCYGATVAILLAFVWRKFSPWVAVLVVGLLAMDPAFFRTMDQVRGQAALALCFTLVGVSYIRGIETGKDRWFIVAGFVTGIGFLVGLIAVWMLVAMVSHQVLGRGLTRHRKEKLLLALSLAVVLVPYGGWVLLSPERVKILLGHLSLYFAQGSGSFLIRILKRPLYPAADFYWMVTKYMSWYPLVLSVVLLALIRSWRRYSHLLLLIFVPWVLVVFNLPTPRYLIPTIPLGYIGLSYVLGEADLVPWLSHGRKLKGWVAAVGGGLIIIGVGVNGFRSLQPPALNPDVDFYQTVFETYTEPGSVIATDLGLIFSATEGRKLITTGPFIWQGFRRKLSGQLSYKHIVETLKPDYIILTERKQRYAFSSHPQTKAFKEYLKGTFQLIAQIRHPTNGQLWIYRRLGLAVTARACPPREKKNC